MKKPVKSEVSTIPSMPSGGLSSKMVRKDTMTIASKRRNRKKRKSHRSWRGDSSGKSNPNKMTRRKKKMSQWKFLLFNIQRKPINATKSIPSQKLKLKMRIFGRIAIQKRMFPQTTTQRSFFRPPRESR